ncbi:MAG: four helix bundle protein [Candidatus Omnitrophica bacterium]|nr:four helix bundle protein [Candidatus Omnitrophota bacterium]
MATIHSYKELIVWQKAMDLCLKIFDITERFPKEEQYGLSSQLRRAALSIPSNIAEGRSRGTKREFVQFLRIAYGSSAEVETQLEVAQRWNKTKNADFSDVNALLLEVMKMLKSMIAKLNP